MPPRPDRKEFRRIKPEDDGQKVPAAENEIRVVASRSQRHYIQYALEVLNGTEGKTKNDTIKITGMGAAVYNAVNIAEVVKRRVVGLHQTTDIASVSVTDKYEATEAGKEGLTVERKVATITITLSLKQLDTKHVGYQAPLPADQVSAEEEPREAREPRKPREPKAEGERKPREPRAEGERKPRERKPREPKAEGAEGDRKPREPRAEGDRKPREPRAEGDRKPREPRAEGDRKPREPRAEGDRPPREPRAEGARGGRGSDAPRGGRGSDAPRGGRGSDAPRGGQRTERGGRGGYTNAQ